MPRQVTTIGATANRVSWVERSDDGTLTTEPANGSLRSSGLRSASGKELAPLFSYKGMMSEASLQRRFTSFAETDRVGLGDFVSYHLENAVAANGSVPFYLLIGLCVFISVVFAFIWDEGEMENLPENIFIVFQILLTGGYGTMTKPVQILVFILSILFGVTIVAILVGLITDSVAGYMTGMSEGRSKVVDSGHTLILGWNESTVRCITQIAFLRQGFRMQNETWRRRLFSWERVKPSSPVAFSSIVVMDDRHDKAEMTTLVDIAFKENFIQPKYTRLGKDVIFRKGDPCLQHDLVRVAAHKATSVLITMTEADSSGKEESGGATSNSATIRTCLALRNVMYSNGVDSNGVAEAFPMDLRVVCQLSEACFSLPAAAIVGPDERSRLYPRDITLPINMLMFYCGAKPGLSRVITQLFNFQGVAIRCRGAAITRSGPDGAAGWFVGMKMKEAQVGNCWANAVLLGVADNDFGGCGPHEPLTDFETYGGGICGDIDRTIEATDTLIFLCTSSSPALGPVIDELIQAEIKTVVPPVKTRRKSESASSLAKKGANIHVLLCGFRVEWVNDVRRFKNRLKDLAVSLAPGSTVTCLNLKAREDFDAMLVNSNLGFERTDDGGWTVEEGDLAGITVKHHQGDSTKYDDVAPLFNDGRKFDTVIVLGSIVGRSLSPEARDARVLSTLLILRTLAEVGHAVHIIAEQQLDQTANLAVMPPSKGVMKRSCETDFINTQTIVSRVLVMNLTYPQINDAVTELIMPGGPEIDFLGPDQLGILGKAVSFGTVQYMVVMDVGGVEVEGDAVVIGYYEGSELVLTPSPDTKVTWTDYHRFVVIWRRESAADIRAKRAAKQAEPPGSPPALLQSIMASKLSVDPVQTSKTENPLVGFFKGAEI